MIEKIKVIGFDADDTLWVNETYFMEAEDKFKQLLSSYIDPQIASAELFQTETQNMPIYGYGVKAFTLSLLETAIRITSGKLPVKILEQLILNGKEQLTHPVELLDGVESTLNFLAGRYRLIVVTKGDLLDQEEKLRQSGLEHYFHHVEIMSDKTVKKYQELISHLDIRPEEFLMIGNSLRSDILPPLELGCYAIHVPFHTTWEHENIEDPIINDRFFSLNTLRDIITLLPKEPMHIRTAGIEDLDSIMPIYDIAKQFMQETGNGNQWINGYPSREQILNDIEGKGCHVCVSDEGQILGAFYFKVEDDPTYTKIYDGEWLNGKPYGVAHRMASNRTRKGIADFCLQWCFDQCKNMRVDTHKDNIVMQNILKKNGYIPCGIIYIANGTPRLAFQKTVNVMQ